MHLEDLKRGHYIKNLRVGKAIELDTEGQREEINTLLGTKGGAQREKGGREKRTTWVLDTGSPFLTKGSGFLNQMIKKKSVRGVGFYKRISG